MVTLPLLHKNRLDLPLLIPYNYCCPATMEKIGIII
jgi:hypothetical protein